jgi:hypothetical protein
MAFSRGDVRQRGQRRRCGERVGLRVNARRRIHRRDMRRRAHSRGMFSAESAWRLPRRTRDVQRRRARTAFPCERIGRWLSASDAGAPIRTETGKAMFRPLLLVVLLAFGSAAHAASIYKCTAPQGGTVFSQTPCGSDAKVTGGSPPPTAPAFDAGNDKIALASIDTRCDARSHEIVDAYRAQFADANASLAEMHGRVIKPGTSEKDPAVQKEIGVVEARKTELLGQQDRELSTLRDECQAQRSAELKRESDRDAARTTARR